MQAVILVGGKATRLLPLTNNTPKAIVPVLNRPLLEHVIRHLAGHRIEDIILAQGHLAQLIEGYLGNGSRFGVSLSYVVEDTPLGTAGALKNAAGYLDDTFLMLNGDVFTDLDITAMLEFHRQQKAMATIALTPVDDPTSYGLVETTPENRVARFLEKPGWNEVTTNMINAGTYVLEKAVLAQIPLRTKVSIEREVFPRLLTGHQPVYAFLSSAYWIDIGTPEKYLQLHRDLLSGKCRNCLLAPTEEVTIGENSHIHPSARIRGPVIIGADCTIGENVALNGPLAIGDGAIIREDSIIEDSVIWQNSRLGARVSLKSSILADNCHLNEGSSAENVVLGDNVTIAGGCKLEPGSRIGAGTTVSASP
ncbi:MAG: NDP-sugar synthase [Dehalococcoidales bacterium]|nr:NDP-sugar synthase [Dehalococcoidales bacterium]